MKIMLVNQTPMETCQVFYTNSPRNTLTSMDITHSRTSAIVLNHDFLDFMITLIEQDSIITRLIMDIL